ncbi:hypothetical protein GCM10008101_20320 [Lysobacter xinjiangensis]|uniref:Uncharacterized protein n=1 Tax=Cognatilysobacter xinjiangensis TaxID=546892 RepID=A0ABQ3C3G6_9GAMM|nr:hypothetical protein [Lysobacter xinjiangensis]GGZ66137.1 hypothetical protein GCM10008101_20320 [Lysobacter xinjiangensis]
MSKSKKPAAENAVLTQATNKGRVDTQTQRDATRLYKDNQSDQSEGAKAEGQPTAMHGRGAGFSRNTH